MTDIERAIEQLREYFGIKGDISILIPGVDE